MARKKFMKVTISEKEYSDIVNTGEASRKILEDPTFKFLRDYLENAKKSIIDLFVNNRIKTVKETVILNDNSQKTFETTRKEQEQELSGQFKFIEQLLADLQYNVQLPDDLIKQFEGKKIVIEHLKGKA